MTWVGSLHTKVVNGLHKTPAENVVPHSVHRHTSQQWISIRNQPPSQTQTIDRLSLQRCSKNIRRSPRDRLSVVGLIVLPSLQHKRRLRSFCFVHNHHPDHLPARFKGGIDFNERAIGRRGATISPMFLGAGIEIGKQTVVIPLWKRVKFVVVTAAAIEREPQKDRSHGLHSIRGILIEILCG